jgi:hypothetical protein
LLGGLFIAAGCSGHFEGSVYRDDQVAFSIEHRPAGWRQIEVSEGLLAFRDDQNDGTVAVNGRCGKDGDDVPLESLMQHLFIYFTEREIRKQETVAIDGREALRSELSAKLDGVRRGFVVYVLKKDGCVYDFLYISDPATLRAGAAAFDDFVTSFHTLEPE